MSPFDEFFRRTSAAMLDTATANGAEADGDVRSIFVEELLTVTYPDRYVHVGGEIIDASGESSNRVGAVLYDPHLPVLSRHERSRYLSAGVHAHIDVKADLFGEIDHALSKVDSIKRLDVERLPVDESVEDRNHHFSGIVAFEGPDPETFKESVLRYYANRDRLDHCVDVICVLGQYVMVTQFTGRDPGFTFLRTEEDSLMVFFVNLAGAVSTNYWGRRPILSAYMELTEAEGF